MKYLQKYENIHDDYDQEKNIGDLVRLSKGYLKRNKNIINKNLYRIKNYKNKYVYLI